MLCFLMIRVSGQSKSRPVEAAGAEASGPRTTPKLRTAVTKSTRASENAQKTSFSEYFLKFRCRKMARRRSAKSTFASQTVEKQTVPEHFLKF